MSVTTRLRVSEWQLINLMYHHFGSGMATSGANVDVVAAKGLAEHGLVRGVDLAGDNVDVPAAKAVTLRRVTLELTAAGVAWVTGNPQNSALRLLKERGRRGAALPDLLLCADVGQLLPLYRAGLLELRNADGERVGNRPTFEEAATYGFGQNWPGVVVVITAKGRSLVDS